MVEDEENSKKGERNVKERRKRRNSRQKEMRSR